MFLFYGRIYGTIVVNNSYTGLALRNEEIIYADRNGYVNYYRKDGSKAGVGDLVYSVDMDGAIAAQINSANENASSLDAENLSKLEKKISEYSNSYQPKSFYDIYSFKNDINSELSEALSMGALNSIADTVTAAESNSTFYKGTAQKDGIVVYYTDGFEGVTTQNFTLDMFEESNYKKVNLIGTSGGALVAINVALERPDLVNKIVADSFEGEFALDHFASIYSNQGITQQ